MWAITACDDVRARMWNDGGVRNVLVSSAAAEGQATSDAASELQLEEVRSRALNALANLAINEDNQVSMWTNEKLSRLLIRTISTGGPLRADALAVVIELTKCFENCASMVRFGVHDILGAAAEDEALGEAERLPCSFARDRLLWYENE